MDDLADPDTPSTAGHPGFAADAFQVALTIELDHVDVPLARIQALQNGAVLPLAGMEGRLPVRILAGTRCIATGQIVSIGDAHGVLIDALHREG